MATGTNIRTYFEGNWHDGDIPLMKAAVHGMWLGSGVFEDARDADEMFLSGNMSKVTPVTAFDDVSYQVGPVTRRARDLYWAWAEKDRAKRTA